jgi:hypothetical protein
MAKFSEPEGDEAGPAANVQHAERRLADDAGKQIEPRLALLLTDQAMTGLVVECARPPIPVMPDDVSGSVATAGHTVVRFYYERHWLREATRFGSALAIWTVLGSTETVFPGPRADLARVPSALRDDYQ